MSEDVYPLFAYEYELNGRYGRPKRIGDERTLAKYFRENLKKILAEKRELRITDTDDLMCFHVANGKVLYDGRSPVN